MRETMTADDLAAILPRLDSVELKHAIRDALADPTTTDVELNALRAEYELRTAKSERVAFH
jgi:hypothetical protein